MAVAVAMPKPVFMVPTIPINDSAIIQIPARCSPSVEKIIGSVRNETIGRINCATRPIKKLILNVPTKLPLSTDSECPEVS